MATAFEAVEAVVGDACEDTLFKWGVRKTWAEGGEDPLEKVWAYACDRETPHWHYVTAGMADANKSSGVPGASGVGYELTFRLKRQADEEEAPIWPVQALQEMGWGILKTNMELDAGHYLRRRRVITGGKPPTALLGYYLVKDPELSPIQSETGSISFLQLVGITDDELLQCEAGEPDEMEAALRARSPVGITDLERTTPRTPQVDLLRLQALQNALVQQCLTTAPDGVTRFSLTATAGESGLSVEIDCTEPFEPNARAVATLRRIVALHAAAGHEIVRIRSEIFADANKAWALVMEFDYG